MAPRSAVEPSGPLDPDPFLARETQPIAWTWGEWLDFHSGRWPHGWSPPYLLDQAFSFPLLEPIETTLTTIAFIPSRRLPVPFRWVFADDGVESQPEWLSTAFMQNQFRMAHGLRLQTYSEEEHGFLPIAPRGAVLGKANPTVVRPLGKRFKAPIEEAHLPAGHIMPPPGVPSARGEMIAVSSSMRSMNGFLATAVGRGLSAGGKATLRMLGRTPSRAAPEIGSTIQAWLAADGCKCFAVAHNWFPTYNVYVDGVRVNWSSDPAFSKFDGFDIDVEWQPFLAFLLYEALRPYPIHERYPGMAAVGWYRSVTQEGEWSWCDEAPKPHLIEFPGRPDDEGVVRWWRNFVGYVRHVSNLMREMTRERGREGWHVMLERAAGVWRETELDQRRWSVTRLRSRRRG